MAYRFYLSQPISNILAQPISDILPIIQSYILDHDMLPKKYRMSDILLFADIPYFPLPISDILTDMVLTIDI